MPTSWDMFCNGMSIMQDGRVLINGGTKGYGALAVVGVRARFLLLACQTLRFLIRATESFIDVDSDGPWALVPNRH